MTESDAHGDVPSPCVRVCFIHPPSGYCVGCFRTLDEIAAWGSLDNREKREVLGLLPERRRRVGEELARGGGHAPDSVESSLP
jgi:predicted Fe-S protein YdhL (DUF1289 family)